jgi:hypothetical protein
MAKERSSRIFFSLIINKIHKERNLLAFQTSLKFNMEKHNFSNLKHFVNSRIECPELSTHLQSIQDSKILHIIKIMKMVKTFFGVTFQIIFSSIRNGFNFMKFDLDG